MGWTILSPDVLITLAGGCFVLGYLIINQVALRLALLIGSMFYIWYYATVADEPLWGAIYLSLAMIATNMIGIGGLWARQSKWVLPKVARDIYPRFSHIPPGDFRALLGAASRYVVDDDTMILRTGARAQSVFYVISGGADVVKQGSRFAMPSGVLLGEVAYLRSRPASADIMLRTGSEVLEWNADTLGRKSAKSARFKLAFEAMVSIDLAEKVAHAVAPAHLSTPAPFAKGEQPSTSDGKAARA